MKALIFSAMAVAALLLVGWQHQQVGRLRAENTTLQESSAEASQLKADLEKSTGNEAQDAAEIDRLREENRDLLKLRNEVNQLREARAEFQKVTAENLRLQTLAKNAPKPLIKEIAMQPLVVRIESLSNQGWGSPEAVVQTLFWAEREGDKELLSRCILPEHRALLRDGLARGLGLDFQNTVSIEIVARRDVDATTVQLGIQVHSNGGRDRKIILTLKLRGGDWQADVTSG